MSFYGAMLGKIYSLGVELELLAGVNFAGGLKATRNLSTSTIDVELGDSPLTPRGTENFSSDVYPSTQVRGTVATGGSVTHDVATAEGKRCLIVADVWVDNGAGGACLFAKALSIVAHQTGGAAVEVTDTTLHDNSGAGFTFLSAASTTNIRFTLANSSGTDRPYNIVISVASLDKP